MKALERLLIPLAAAALCSCATTEVGTEFAPGIKADGREPAALVTAENYGYYLFGLIPIVAGDPDSQNEVSLSLFEDTVTVENNHAMISRELERLGAPSMTAARDSVSWTGGFSLWIVWKQVLKTSALALKPEPSAVPAEGKNTLP